MNIKTLKASFFGAIASLTFLAGTANAQPLEDVSLQYGDGGIVATIKLSGPIRYQRHFPIQQGKTLEIFYDRLQDASTTEWLDDETRQSPPSGLIPSFTVTTRDQKVRPKLVIEFSRPAEYTVAAGSDGRSLLVTIKPDKRQQSMNEAIPALPLVKPLSALGTSPDQNANNVNQQAFELMNAGRNALSGKDNASAIEVFNKLLSLPPNPYTADAQEWIGVARERSGQPDRAKAEYELYLKLYPTSEGTERVKMRLAGVGDKKSTALLGTETDGKKRESQNFAFGGITSRYYYGQITLDSTYQFNNAPSTATYSATDQSMLVTTVDATERFVSDTSDNRLVFRDIQTHNFLTTKSVNSTQNTNRVNAAYWENKNRANDYSFRLGRQNGYGGGILGRYDGASGSYGSAENWKTNAVVGRVVDFTNVTKPVFYGMSVDRGPVSLYAINQTVDGYQDRKAIGSEYRYFEGRNSAYAQLDYDLYFKALNAAMVNGMVGINDVGTNLIFMLDHRRVPSLSIRNALNGGTATSVSQLMQIMTQNELRSLALSRTGTSNFSQLGVTHPVSPKWQVGADVKLSNVSGLPATDPAFAALPADQQLLIGILPTTAGTGSTRTLTGQVIGNNIVSNLDIWSVSVNFMSGSLSSGRSIFIYNHQVPKERWAVDTSWLYFKQDNLGSGVVTRNTPMVRATYRYKDNLSFDGDFGLEFSNASGAFQTSSSSRKFFSLGLNWDF